MSAIPAEVALALAALEQHWAPRTIARAADHDVRVAKLLGELDVFTRDTVDELYLVVYGTLRIRFADAPEVTVRAGESYLVPRGTVCHPVADHEVGVVLVGSAA
ncbi:MAG: cupin domain-containing protein [Leifsonia xyli]|nr:MAG: cupin domain-containing protein [Leifsonia xyli]